MSIILLFFGTSCITASSRFMRQKKKIGKKKRRANSSGVLSFWITRTHSFQSLTKLLCSLWLDAFETIASHFSFPIDSNPIQFNSISQSHHKYYTDGWFSSMMVLLLMVQQWHQHHTTTFKRFIFRLCCWCDALGLNILFYFSNPDMLLFLLYIHNSHSFRAISQNVVQFL